MTLTAPDFASIRSEAGHQTSDAIKLLWELIMTTIQTGQSNLLRVAYSISPGVKTSGATTNQNNFDTEAASVVYFTGASAFNLTGLLAPETGRTRLLIIHNTGAGTITAKHESASSVAANRLHLSTGADRTIATDASMLLLYAGAKWRDITL